MLTSNAFERTRFCVDDVALYYQFEDKSHSLPLNDALRVELVLNALVALRFLKPQMPKSWHFQRQNNTDEWQPAGGDSVLAQPCLMLAGRRMALGDAIKIMHDRLQPAPRPDDLQYAPAV